VVVMLREIHGMAGFKRSFADSLVEKFEVTCGFQSNNTTHNQDAFHNTEAAQDGREDAGQAR